MKAIWSKVRDGFAKMFRTRWGTAVVTGVVVAVLALVAGVVWKPGFGPDNPPDIVQPPTNPPASLPPKDADERYVIRGGVSVQMNIYDNDDTLFSSSVHKSGPLFYSGTFELDPLAPTPASFQFIGCDAPINEDGEVTVILDVNVALTADGKGSRVTGEANLYEQTECDPDDHDGRQSFDLTVNSTAKTHAFRIGNTDEPSSGDYADVTITIGQVPLPVPASYVVPR